MNNINSSKPREDASRARSSTEQANPQVQSSVYEASIIWVIFIVEFVIHHHSSITDMQLRDCSLPWKPKVTYHAELE